MWSGDGAKRSFAGVDVGPLFYSEASPDGDFHPLPDATMDEALAAFLSVARDADVIYRGASLDEPERCERGFYSLRWVLIHLIEEYARHLGHADLIREAIDRQTGE
jgi:hypothetical protein